MITRSQKIRLGVFITVAMVILIGILAVLSLDRFLTEKDVYYIAYENVSVLGLDVGSNVKYLGINVGTVRSIRIDPDDINRVIVTIGLDTGTPIKNDVRADISTMGITGIKLIELRGGSNEAELLQPGGYIQPGKSLTEDITGKAEVIAEKFELMLNNLLKLTRDSNQDKLFNLIDETAVTVSNFNAVLKDNQQKIDFAFSNLDTAMAQIAEASKSASSTMFLLETFFGSDSFRVTLKNIAEVAEKLNKANIYDLDKEVNIAMDKVNQLLRQIELIVSLNENKFSQTLDDLNETVRYLNNAARQIDEDPSVLLGGSKPSNPPDDNLEQ